MGIYRYTTFLRERSKKNKLNDIPSVDYCFIDGNCIIYNAFNQLQSDVSELPEKVRALYKTWIDKINAKEHHIVFDGIPPLPKRKCQKERRNGITTAVSFILPDTPLMKAISAEFEFKCEEFSPACVGEGEHKIFRHIRTNINHYKDKSILIHTVDSDVILLSQILEKEFQIKLYVLNYNEYYDGSVDIAGLNNHLFKDWSVEKLLLFSYLAGNDYVDTTPSVDEIKKLYSSLDKLDTSRVNVTTKCCKNIKDYIRLWQWYYAYYTSSLPLEIEDYSIGKVPCFYCFFANKSNKAYETRYITITHNEHLTDIFGDRYRDNLYYSFKDVLINANDRG